MNSPWSVNRHQSCSRYHRCALFHLLLKRGGDCPPTSLPPLRRRHRRKSSRPSAPGYPGVFFSFAVRSVYIESSSTFVRGGVYRRSDAWAGHGLPVRLLVFDYISPAGRNQRRTVPGRLLMKWPRWGSERRVDPFSSPFTSASSSPPTSGGATSRVSTSRAARPRIMQIRPSW